MDNFNKLVSFILGLVVIVVFFAVLSGKFNIKNKLPVFGRPTPTPSPIYSSPPAPTDSLGYGASGGGQENRRYETVNTATIPATGSPTLFLPFLFGGAALGSYLRKKK